MHGDKLRFIGTMNLKVIQTTTTKKRDIIVKIMGIYSCRDERELLFAVVVADVAAVVAVVVAAFLFFFWAENTLKGLE